MKQTIMKQSVNRLCVLLLLCAFTSYECFGQGTLQQGKRAIG